MKAIRFIITVVFLVFFAAHEPALAQYAEEPEDQSIDNFFDEDADDDEEVIAPPPQLFHLFIDPGHGGVDLGVQSRKHLLEKNLTLSLAKLIAKKMEPRARSIKVTISRLDDKEVTLISRIEKANKAMASLYVSIHIAGASRPLNRPLTIYYYSEEDSEAAIDGDRIWRRQNRVFADENAKFARLLLNALKRASNREITIIKTRRIAFLGGLSMPAVMVEVADLASPEDEMKLLEEGYLNRIASAFILAVEQYYAWGRAG